MPFKKGQSGNPNGRKKGSQNKVNKKVREVFAEAFDNMQQDKATSLTTWGRANPTEFYKLSAKLIPLQITGEEGKEIEIIRRTITSENDK